MANSEMSNDTVIEFDGVSKVYRLGRRTGKTLKEAILKRPRGGPSRSFYALEDVSFRVKRGEILGLVGDNGSGKSTILKIIAGITEQSSGKIRTVGRTSALLEVGAGFHPEMTGRENVFLSGTIMGIDRKELASKYDDIVAFAELGEFMDTPVKFYSSGMYLRLGFAVAMNVNPDILLIDEVFSVGDNVFQARCRQELQRFRREGKTILFVSHDMLAIQSFCTRAVYMDHGKLVKEGDTDAVVFEYERHIQERRLKSAGKEGSFSTLYKNRLGTQEVQITKVHILDETGVESKEFEVGRPIRIDMHFRNLGYEKPVVFNLALSNHQDDKLFVCGTREDGLHIQKLPKEGIIRLSFPAPALVPGVYFVSFGLFDSRITFTEADMSEYTLDLYRYQHHFFVRRTEHSGKCSGELFLHRHWQLEDNGKVTAEIKE